MATETAHYVTITETREYRVEVLAGSAMEAATLARTTHRMIHPDGDGRIAERFYTVSPSPRDNNLEMAVLLDGDLDGEPTTTHTRAKGETVSPAPVGVGPAELDIYLEKLATIAGMHFGA